MFPGCWSRGGKHPWGPWQRLSHLQQGSWDLLLVSRSSGWRILCGSRDKMSVIPRVRRQRYRRPHSGEDTFIAPVANILRLKFSYSTVSFVPMELCSNRSISSVTGGSMWTAPEPDLCGSWTMRLLCRDNYRQHLNRDNDQYSTCDHCCAVAICCLLILHVYITSHVVRSIVSWYL